MLRAYFQLSAITSNVDIGSWASLFYAKEGISYKTDFRAIAMSLCVSLFNLLVHSIYLTF
jgi:hypothetical protein